MIFVLMTFCFTLIVGGTSGFDPVSGNIGKTPGIQSEEDVSKPYVCRLCTIEQRFEKEFSLKCHLKLVHGQDPEVSSTAQPDSTGETSAGQKLSG